MNAVIQFLRLSVDHDDTSVPLDALNRIPRSASSFGRNACAQQVPGSSLDFGPHVKYSSDVCSEGRNYTFPYAKYSHSAFHRGLCFPLAWILAVPLSFSSTFSIIHVFLQFIIHTVAMYHETKRDGYAALIISKCLLVHLADVRIYL